MSPSPFPSLSLSLSLLFLSLSFSLDLSVYRSVHVHGQEWRLYKCYDFETEEDESSHVDRFSMTRTGDVPAGAPLGGAPMSVDGQASKGAKGKGKNKSKGESKGKGKDEVAKKEKTPQQLSRSVTGLHACICNLTCNLDRSSSGHA